MASIAGLDPDSRREAARAGDEFVGDPLWPALARHVARMSTPDDRALLSELAARPELREPPLSWGLRHYVRGDVVMEDERIVTLDELCAMAAIPPLPLLEDLPPEVDPDDDDDATLDRAIDEEQLATRVLVRKRPAAVDEPEPPTLSASGG